MARPLQGVLHSCKISHCLQNRQLMITGTQPAAVCCLSCICVTMLRLQLHSQTRVQTNAEQLESLTQEMEQMKIQQVSAACCCILCIMYQEKHQL